MSDNHDIDSILNELKEKVLKINYQLLKYIKKHMDQFKEVPIIKLS